MISRRMLNGLTWSLNHGCEVTHDTTKSRLYSWKILLSDLVDYYHSKCKRKMEKHLVVLSQQYWRLVLHVLIHYVFNSLCMYYIFEQKSLS